jgi:hypothetical protein
MVKMALEIRGVRGPQRIRDARVSRTSSLPFSNPQESKAYDLTEDHTPHNLDLSAAILNALGDESSRKILTSAIARGRTVEEISAEQQLPLSTCYRRLRLLVGEGLMILERTVVTPAGKRYAIYRTSFSDAAMSFKRGEIVVQVTPNFDIIEKLRRRWLSASYPSWRQDDSLDISSSRPNIIEPSSGPFE